MEERVGTTREAIGRPGHHGRADVKGMSADGMAVGAHVEAPFLRACLSSGQGQNQKCRRAQRHQFEWQSREEQEHRDDRDGDALAFEPSRSLSFDTVGIRFWRIAI